MTVPAIASWNISILPGPMFDVGFTQRTTSTNPVPDAASRTVRASCVAVCVRIFASAAPNWAVLLAGRTYTSPSTIHAYSTFAPFAATCGLVGPDVVPSVVDTGAGAPASVVQSGFAMIVRIAAFGGMP